MMPAASPEPCETHCLPALRLYAAVSQELIRRVLSGDPRVKEMAPHVFKVGTTDHTCADRKFSLDQRIVNGRRPRFFGHSSAYAGVGDWEFLRCWPVAKKDHDHRVFRRWVERIPGVWQLARCSYVHSVNGSWAGCIDLYAMTEKVVWAEESAIRYHPIHRDLLLAVAAKLRELVPRGSPCPGEPR